MISFNPIKPKVTIAKPINGIIKAKDAKPP